MKSRVLVLGLITLAILIIAAGSVSAAYENACYTKKYPSSCYSQGNSCRCVGKIVFKTSYIGGQSCWDGIKWIGGCSWTGGQWAYAKKGIYQVKIDINNPANHYRRTYYYPWQRYQWRYYTRW